MLKEAWKEYTHNSSHADNPNLFWEAGKAFLRGRIISFVSAYKKNAHKTYLETSHSLRNAQKQLTERNTPENRKTWQEAKDRFEIWAHNLERKKMTHTQLHFHKFGNKAGKLLARLSKDTYLSKHFTALHNPDSTLSTSPKDINKTLETFYANLYAQEPIDPLEATKWL